MRLTDPVADMLARIRNAIRARHQKVDIPASKLKTEIARILKEEGYIANFKPAEEEAVITNLARVSRPGCRVYVRRTEIPRVLGGMGINILTTPKGVMTGREARREGERLIDRAARHVGVAGLRVQREPLAPPFQAGAQL